MGVLRLVKLARQLEVVEEDGLRVFGSSSLRALDWLLEASKIKSNCHSEAHLIQHSTTALVDPLLTINLKLQPSFPTLSFVPQATTFMLDPLKHSPAKVPFRCTL